MTTKKTTSKKVNTTSAFKEVYEKFKAGFPDEAYSVDKSRNTDRVLTSLKAQYVIERLNDTLMGVGGWYLTGDYQETDNGVLYFGQLYVTVGEEAVTIENVGFGSWQAYSNDGDVYKAAKTDCLSKCGSYLGIGNEVFKGKVILEESNESEESHSSFTEDPVEEELYEDGPVEEEQQAQQDEPRLRTSRTFNRGSRFGGNEGSRFANN